ncbi:MAG: AAA family ATPase [Polyangiales bacterium]
MALDALVSERGWHRVEGVFPLRINLPSLARWMASQRSDRASTLWQHLASRMSDELAAHGLSGDLSPDMLASLVREAGVVLWILDGLDEVPRSAGREAVISVVRAGVCEGAPGVAGLVVATRPQGYEGEFDELDVMSLSPLPAKVSLDYGERLVRAWATRAGAADIESRLDALRAEFTKPEVALLLQTPLHTTIAAVLVAGRGTLPKSRYQLFQAYFATVLRRELNKPIEYGVTDEDESILRTLHAQAGILLHTRSQEQPGARASLRRKELREILSAIYESMGYGGDERRAKVERILRFAAERLVLLIHDVEGEYAFGVRSLQEFFAAEALVEGDVTVAAARIDAVVRSPHWSNVIAFVVSRFALATTRSAIDQAVKLTVERCEALNRGEAGPEAARCMLGSHLALSMMRETARYGAPWLHDKLWDVAFAAAMTPAQGASAEAVGRERSGAQARNSTWWDDEEIHVRLGMVAAWPAGDGGVRRRRQLIDAAAALFRQGEEGTLLGWRLLHGLLVAGDPEAAQLATLNAPSTESQAWAAVDAGAYVGDYVMPKWWCEFLDAHPDWFSPGRLVRMFNCPDVQVSVLAFDLINDIFSGFSSRWFGLSLDGDESRCRWCSISEYPSLVARIDDATVPWPVWASVSKFLFKPSHLTLADLLQTVAEVDALQELLPFIEVLPWPLAACLAVGTACHNLIELVKLAREGTLGHLDHWLAAEARWSAAGRMTLVELEERFASDLPWNTNISARGMPAPISIESGNPFKADDIVAPWIEAHPEQSAFALTLLKRSTYGYLSPASLRLYQIADKTFCGTEYFPLRWVGWIAFNYTGPDRDGWFALFDARGRRGLNVHSEFEGPHVPPLLRELLHQFRERPDQWGLLNAIVNLPHALSRVPPADLVLPPPPPDASSRAHAESALLELLARRVDDSALAAFFPRLVWHDDTTHDLRTSLALVLRHRVNDHEATRLILAALDAEPPPTAEARDELLGVLFERARRLPSAAFSTPEAWKDHALPEPFLAGQVPPRQPPVIVSLDVLRNVRLFAETPSVDVALPRPLDDNGQWIVLVGQNGVGKTTLLRAIALALADPAVASKLLDERLPLVRNGGEARVAITLDSGRREIAIRRGDRTDTIEAVTPLTGERPWVVGYGVRRGNALGEKDRATELGAVGELHTLFERPAALHPAAQWLRDLDADVLREQRRSPRGANAPTVQLGPREAVWRSVLHALQTLLGVTAVEVEEGGAVFVTHPEMGRVPFEAMSDGYLGTAGWLIDMIARWIDRQRELDEPVGANLLRQMCGLALIDEIDLHLHPVWQMKIIEDVRRLFPRMSFVVTTHNPLALHGARVGEVYVMRREGAKIELSQRDIRPGQDVDRVLFEQFGVKHTLDRETRDLLAKHQQMVERGVSFDDPERKRVEAQIIERFGDVGATLRDERRAEDSSPLRSDEQGLLDEFLKGS